MSTQSSNRIEWGELKDRHLRGQFKRVHVWIRLNRQDQATGVYLMIEGSDDWEKHVPGPEETWSLEDAKALAELGTEALLATEAVMRTLSLDPIMKTNT